MEEKYEALKAAYPEIPFEKPFEADKEIDLLRDFMPPILLKYLLPKALVPVRIPKARQKREREKFVDGDPYLFTNPEVDVNAVKEFQDAADKITQAMYG